MMSFSSRIKSKILMAAMVNKAVDAHQKHQQEIAADHAQLILKTEESSESQGADEEQLILKQYLL
jgi:hypothetical protein